MSRYLWCPILSHSFDGLYFAMLLIIYIMHLYDKIWFVYEMLWIIKLFIINLFLFNLSFVFFFWVSTSLLNWNLPIKINARNMLLIKFETLTYKLNYHEFNVICPVFCVTNVLRSKLYMWTSSRSARMALLLLKW